MGCRFHGWPGCRDAAIGNGTFGGQAWLEAGWGGLSW